MAQRIVDGAYEEREAYLERLAADIEPLRLEEPDWLQAAVAEISTWWYDSDSDSEEEN